MLAFQRDLPYWYLYNCGYEEQSSGVQLTAIGFYPPHLGRAREIVGRGYKAYSVAREFGVSLYYDCELYE